MIIKGLFLFIILFLNIVFGWVNFLDMPSVVDEVFIIFLFYMFVGMGFVWFIVLCDFVLVVVSVVLVFSNFDKLYSVVMWVLKKILFLGIE